jgi:hypothetical protein
VRSALIPRSSKRPSSPVGMKSGIPSTNNNLHQFRFGVDGSR